MRTELGGRKMFLFFSCMYFIICFFHLMYYGQLHVIAFRSTLFFVMMQSLLFYEYTIVYLNVPLLGI